MPATTEPTPAASGRRRRLLSVLYICLLVVGVLIAWRVHLAWRRAGVRPGGGRFDRRLRATTAPAPVASQPGDFVAGALGVEGLGAVAGDPAGIAPPASAKHLSTFRLPDGSLVGRYDWPGQVAAAADHYARSLPGKGFRLLSDAADRGGRRVLVMAKGETNAIITLRKGGKNGNIVRIVVTVMAPSGPRAGRQ